MSKTIETYRSATPEELLENPDVTNVVEQTEVIESTDLVGDEKLKYDQRVIDGQNAYLSLMAELRLTGIANGYPRSVLRGIEDKLELVKSQVVDGQWVSAREKLEDVVVESPLSQELYDRIKDTLETYILTSYGKSYQDLIV